MSNLGNDLMLNDYDIVIGANGDYLTTLDYEKTLTNLRYEGYICVRETIARIIEYSMYELDMFERAGVGANKYISSNVNNIYNTLIDKIKEELIKDDRIRSVDNVEVTQVTLNIVTITVNLVVINSDELSEFVFPFIKR